MRSNNKKQQQEATTRSNNKKQQQEATTRSNNKMSAVADTFHEAFKEVMKNIMSKYCSYEAPSFSYTFKFYQFIRP